MTASSAGNDTKGGKTPVVKAGKTGARVKGSGDKVSGSEGKREGKGRGGLDTFVRTATGENLDRKTEVRKGKGKMAEMEGVEYDKKEPSDVLQQIVHKRENEIKELEEKMKMANDGNTRSALAVQLKGAQHALKEALVNMSLTQKTGLASVRGKEQEDEDVEMQEDHPIEKSKGVRNEDEAKEVDVKERTETEFYVDLYEGGSEESEEGCGKEIEEAHTKYKKQKDRKDVVISIDDTTTNQQSIAWGDISDDDTVIQTNMENDNDNEWQIAINKKNRKSKESNKNKQEDVRKETTKSKVVPSNKSSIVNPYKTKQGPQEIKKNSVQVQSSLASYAKVTMENQRSVNDNSIRVTTSFTPRLAGIGEYKRVAKELLGYAKEIAQEVMMLPWNDHSGLGPITVEDLSNPRNYIDTIKNYFDKPAYVTMQPGTPAYGIGVRFSVNCSKYEFLNKWNMRKREYKLNNRAAYTINLAPMQSSPTAFIIGVAVGSTEDQDITVLNKRLEQATGIKGIEVSYQNIHQAGITAEFWQMANNKAMKSSVDKTSRDYLRTKYSWAPNGLAIYVPKREMVKVARKIMLKLYGRTDNGYDPVWPDGSSMRFLPMKGAAIRNEKTKEIVRKRLAYHIWIKANELSTVTNMVNIHQTIEAFEGKTFSDIILETTSNKNADVRIFSHFNRAWSMDPTEEKWALSIKNQCEEEAARYIQNCRDYLFDKYGQEIDKFFNNDRTSKEWVEVVNSNKNQQEEEDDWFEEEDDDIDELVKKGLIEPAFLQFLTGKDNESDRQSVASWGTGDTAYTEIVDNKDNTSTVSSNLTQESALEAQKDLQTKKETVIGKLRENGVHETIVKDIMDNVSPYELVFSGIRLSTWNPEKEIFYISALLESNNTTDKTNEDDE